MKFKTIVAASKISLLAVGFTVTFGNALQAVPSFLADFSGYGDSESVLGTDWRFVLSSTVPDPNNAAFVSVAGTHVTVTANGNGDRVNARLAARNPAPLPVSDTENNRIQIDIRLTTPGTSGNMTITYLNMQQALGGTGAFNMGFLNGSSVFFDFGGSGNRISKTGLTIDPEAWYRFIAEFTPSTGLAEFRVLKLGEDVTEIVVTGDNLSEEKPPFFAAEFITVEMDVTRPGSSGVTSSDFDNIIVTAKDGTPLNPDPFLGADASAQVSEAVELSFDSQSNKYYQIGLSSDLMTWTIDEPGVIGDGKTARRFYLIDGLDRGFFRVRSN